MSHRYRIIIGGVSMKTLAMPNTILNEKDIQVLDTKNRPHESILRNLSTNKKLSEYEKTFLEMTDDEMKSLILSMNGE